MKESDARKYFIDTVQALPVTSECVIVKPNWVSDRAGEYIEHEILDWYLDSLPKGARKIVVESYTPWRGLADVTKKDALPTDLDGSKGYAEKYRENDKRFLEQTLIGSVLKKHGVEYINVTEECWAGRTVPEDVVATIVSESGKAVFRREFFKHVPSRLFDLREKATFVSLAKVKFEQNISSIYVSLSVKNLFGMLPHPSRKGFHGADHRDVPQAVADVYNIYTSLFKDTRWVCEGMRTLVRNYCQEEQIVETGHRVAFAGTDGIEVDSEACRRFGIDPADVPYFMLV